ncbi:T9SS type A sorting domain-containing protein [Flavobacterium sp. N3904]|uniref:T9SS type A sorting domain-containing protein n=1 Tax=Flavobacterium sp. N3904 TaxID=2986835 RepID=UPI0022245E19|nr:T9SS type A sorting domain-containing protein [Flavobacterium sp. N3904]
MKKLYSLLLLAIFGFFSSYAQTIDETFIKPIPYKAAKISVIRKLPDGKILLGGDIAFYKDKKVNNLIRLNADYSLDETFLFNDPDNLKIKKVQLQSNGDIVVLAHVDNPYNFNNEKGIIFQLSTEGEIKTEITGLVDITSIGIQNDDKILVSGGTWAVDNGYLRRYNSDFSIDETFKNDIFFDKEVTDVKVFGSSIYASGLFSLVDGITKNSIVKLNPDGIIDASFDVGVGANGHGFSMTPLDDGKLIVSGNFLSIVDNVQSYNMARLNLDGSIDDSFSSQYYSYANSSVVIKDSFIYLDAEINDGIVSRPYLIRLNADGALDERFNRVKLDEFGMDDFALNFIDDKIFYTNSGQVGNRYGLSISDLDGNTIDSSELQPSKSGSFETGGYFDGKLVVKGDFMKINDVETFGIGLLDENGTVDETFVFPKYLGEIRQFQIIDNTTIFVSTKDKFLKLDNTGNILKDFDFKKDSQLLRIEQFKVLDNGKILITDQWGLYILNEEGIQEAIFPINSDPNFWATGIKFEMQNNQIICGYLLNSFSSGYVPKLIRFNLDTSIDSNFNIGQGPDSLFEKIKVLDSGEIIVAGGFLNFNGISVPNQIVKLSKDGEMDVKFNDNINVSPIGNLGGITYHNYSKIEELDSVIYVSEVSVVGPSVTAINLDGTVKNDFEMPTAIDVVNDLIPLEAPVVSHTTSRKAKLVPDANNYIFAIGTVNSGVNGLSSVIVKVNLGAKSGSLSVNPTPEKSTSNVLFYPVPVKEKVNLSFSNSIVPTKVAVYSVNGTELYSSKVQSKDNIDVDMSSFASGVYFIKLFSDLGVTTKKIIKK